MSTSIIRPAARPKLTTRTHLEIGSQIFHNGTPVELLYRVDHDKQSRDMARPASVHRGA